MIKKTSLVYLVVFTVFSCKHDNPEQQLFYPNGKLKSSFTIDDKGRKHGVYKEYYTNGSLKEKHILKNGILTDTSFFFDKSGKLTTISIFAEGENERLKDIFYYTNGKIKEERVFFVGSGKINSYVSYTLEGKAKSGYKESKWTEIRSLGNSILSFRLRGTAPNIDSVTVYFFNTANDETEPYRSDRSFKKDNVIVSVKESDYVNDTLNAIIAVYNFEEGYPNMQPFQIQLVKNQKIPKNNLTPIYGNKR